MKEKNRKIVGMLLVIMVNTIVIAGCGGKELTGEAFLEKVKEVGYTVECPYGVAASEANPEREVAYRAYKARGDEEDYYWMSYFVFQDEIIANEHFARLITATEYVNLLEEKEQQWETEVEQKSNNKYIVRCTGSGSDEEQFYYVMYKEGYHTFCAKIPVSDLNSIEKILEGTGY